MLLIKLKKLFGKIYKFDTAQELLRPRRKIVVVLAGYESDRRFFASTLEVAKAMVADVEILLIDKSTTIELTIADFKEALRRAGIVYRIISVRDWIERQKSKDALDRTDLAEIVTAFSKQHCPLVLAPER